MPTLSDRVHRIVQSDIRGMSVECERVGGINLAQGVCDTEVPEPVRRGVHDAIEQSVNTYSRCEGLRELRSAIAVKLRDFNGVEADPDREIVVSAGSTGAFYCACLALLNPGDEVVIFEPYYGYHVNTLLAVGAVPAYVSTAPPHWEFSIRNLESVASSRLKAIVINTPANPSGKVFTEGELRQVADFARAHDLFVFTDEIYEYFLYDGRRHVSPATLPGMADRTITVSGFSKTLSITGWRIGYCVSSEQWSGMIAYVNDLVYVCAPSPLQFGVAQGLGELKSDYYRGLAQEYERKRNTICDALSSAGLSPYVPQGAYYVLADASRISGSDSRAKATALLEQTGIATVPGEAFFREGAGNNLLRFCFAKPPEELREAARRLARL